MICPKCHKTALTVMRGSFQISPGVCKCGWIDKSLPDSHYKEQAELAKLTHEPNSFLFPTAQKGKINMIKKLKVYFANRFGLRSSFIFFEDNISENFIKKKKLKIYGYDIRNDIPVAVHITGQGINDIPVYVKKISKKCKLYKEQYEKLDPEMNNLRDAAINLIINSGLLMISRPEYFIVVYYKFDRYLGYIHF